MLRIDISAGHHITIACTTAAKLARHPLASQAIDAAWYAFKIDETTAWLEIGPWLKTAAEEYDGQAFWDFCHSKGMRDYVRTRMIGPEPGVCFEFNGERVICEAMLHDDPRTVPDVAADLHRQWDAKMKAASDAYWTPERKAEEAKRQADCETTRADRRSPGQSPVYSDRPRCVRRV